MNKYAKQLSNNAKVFDDIDVLTMEGWDTVNLHLEKEGEVDEAFSILPRSAIFRG